MSQPPFLLEIDILTTGVKALLVDEQGQVVANATSAFNLSTPYPLWSEQDPHEWWSGAENSICNVLAQTGAHGEQVGFSGGKFSPMSRTQSWLL